MLGGLDLPLPELLLGGDGMLGGEGMPGGGGIPPDGGEGSPPLDGILGVDGELVGNCGKFFDLQPASASITAIVVIGSSRWAVKEWRMIGAPDYGLSILS